VNNSRTTATCTPLSVSNPPMADDRTLVSRVLLGDESAFRTMIRQHERLVSHMVGRLIKGPQDREEICQDVFLKVYEKLPEFGFQSKLSTWIATIAYRHAINHLRKKKMEYQEIPEGQGWADQFIDRQDPGEILESQDEDEYILKFVDQLPAQYRAVLTLYHLDGMNYDEIGKVMEMPEGTVKNYLFRARNLLKEKIVRYLDKERV
jgi:RNA polymerase sigma factor (sigma-70 family)